MGGLARLVGVAGILALAGPAAAQDLPKTGRVVDEAGKPVAGAAVGARDALGQARFWWSEGKLQGAETDSAGTFSIEPGWAGGEVVAVAHGRGCSEWLKLVPGTKEVLLKVVPGNVVEGTVRDEKKQTLAGIEVQLATTWEMGHHGPTAVTDKQGKFRIAGVLPGVPWAIGVEATPRVIRVVGGGGPVEGFQADAVEKLLAAGKLFRLDGVGKKLARELVVAVRPGVEVTWMLKPPKGATLPAKVLVTHVTETEDAAGADASGGVSSFSGGDGSSTNVVSEVVDGVLKTRTQRTWWHSLDLAKPALALFLPKGRNSVRLAAGGLAGVVPARVVAGAGPGEKADLALSVRPRLVLQLVDAEGNRLTRAGVQVSYNVSVSRGGSSSSSGTGGPRTDATGRADLTDSLPAVDPAAETAGTRTTVGVGVSGEGLTFPDGGFTWTPKQLADLLANPDAKGEVVVKVKAVANVVVTFRLVEEDGKPVAGLAVSVWVGAMASGTTDDKGEVSLALAPGTHPEVRLNLPQGCETDPIANLVVPPPGGVLVKVRRFLLQAIPVEIEGVPATPGAAAPGPASVRALDAGGADAGPAGANVSVMNGRWHVFVRAPGRTEKLVVTFRDQTLEVATPGGKPVEAAVWKVK
ncbi:MAG: carboxypeptidase-like regulatory domain-containing protein [Planctomycetales bacterium]|nr:carboxypeptidase-like regulatory domain-containing protein [Planctomycetales bacterium]